MLFDVPKPPKYICENISRGGQGYPGGPNGPAAVLWDTQGGATWKCAVSQNPAVVGPATQLPPYLCVKGAPAALSGRKSSETTSEKKSASPFRNGSLAW